MSFKYRKYRIMWWASEQIADPKALARAKPGDVIPPWRSVRLAVPDGVTLTDGGGI